jgi:hypothetical protein
LLCSGDRHGARAGRANVGAACRFERGAPAAKPEQSRACCPGAAAGLRPFQRGFRRNRSQGGKAPPRDPIAKFDKSAIGATSTFDCDQQKVRSRCKKPSSAPLDPMTGFAPLRPLTGPAGNGPVGWEGGHLIRPFPSGDDCNGWVKLPWVGDVQRSGQYAPLRR